MQMIYINILISFYNYVLNVYFFKHIQYFLRIYSFETQQRYNSYFIVCSIQDYYLDIQMNKIQLIYLILYADLNVIL